MRFDYLTTNQESTFVNACLRKFLGVSGVLDGQTYRHATLSTYRPPPSVWPSCKMKATYSSLSPLFRRSRIGTSPREAPAAMNLGEGRAASRSRSPPFVATSR